MQTRPVGWEALLYGAHKVEYKYIINGVEYPAEYIQGTPSIEKPLMLEPVIGRCCTGSFNITVRDIPNAVIPKAAQVKVSCRLVSPDGSITTTWIPQGEYWIVKRKRQGNTLSLTCRDNMIFAGRSYTDKTSFTEWPMPMVSVLAEIAALMNVQIDSRTLVYSGPEYVCDYPNPDDLMSEILGRIAAAHGGNFIITETGKLRLVPFSTTQTPVFDLDSAYVEYLPYSVGVNTVSRLTLVDIADNEFSVGDDSGIEISGVCDSATLKLVNETAYGVYLYDGTMYARNGDISNGTAHIDETNAQLENGTISTNACGLIGRQYQPYLLTGAYFDPCIELGDTYSILYKGEVLHLVANTIKVDCTVGYFCSLENGVQEDDEEEIPYVSPEELKAQRTITSNQRYHGNRINRKEGFISEYMENDVAVARMIANSNLFAMQRNVDGQWEDVLYFDPVTRQYKFSGEVTIDTTQFKASVVSVDNSSLVVAADAEGKALVDYTFVVNVIAQTGSNRVVPTGISVDNSTLPNGMRCVISPTPDSSSRIPIQFIVAKDSLLGSNDSINGVISVNVTSPVQETLKISWCKLNTGSQGIQGDPGLGGVNQTVLQLYQRSATVPSVLSDCEYTFSTNSFSISLGNWQRTIPSGNDPCYTISAVISSREDTVEIETEDWVGPIEFVKNGQNGQPGKDGTSVTILGSYDDAADLPSTGNPGDAYIVNGDLYVWIEENESWQNVGQIQGPKGDNGESRYVYVRYATSSNPSTIYTSPSAARPYIGICVTTSSTAPTNPSSYAPWTKYVGTDGAPGRNSAVVYLYQRYSPVSDSDKPSVPASGALTYVFATATLTPASALGNWSQSIPENGEEKMPCWVTMANAVSVNSSVAINTWATPVKLVEDGEDGVGTETYYCSDAPQYAKEGDLWIDSDDNRMYRYDGTGWESVRDDKITENEQALVSARSNIETLFGQIKAIVEANYVDSNGVSSIVTTAINTLAGSMERAYTQAIRDAKDEVIASYETIIRESVDGIEIGKRGSRFSCLLNNEKLSFRQKIGDEQVEVAYLSNNKLYVTNSRFTNEMVIGKVKNTSDPNPNPLWRWTKTSDGLGLKYVSE